MSRLTLYVALYLVAALDLVLSASVMSSLHVTNGGNQGKWGPEEFCPTNSYADGFWLKVSNVIIQATPTDIKKYYTKHLPMRGS